MSALNSVLENNAGVKVVEVDGVPITITGEKNIIWLNGAVIAEDDGGPVLLNTPGEYFGTTGELTAKIYGKGRVYIVDAS